MSNANMRLEKSFVDMLDMQIKKMLDGSIDRARKNNRKTILKHDL